jgi:hypothetical protein
MHVNAKMVGAGVAAAIAAGLGYALFFNSDDEVEFHTITRDGAFSTRSYPQLRVVETIAEGMRECALSIGYSALAGFLDGASRGGTRLATIAPALVDGDEDGRGWRTRFILPERATEMLPEPDEGIRVRTVPARHMAAVRFSGDADDDALTRHESALRYWMETNGLSPAGPAEHALYNSPLTPAMLRRTEVLIPISAA